MTESSGSPPHASPLGSPTMSDDCASQVLRQPKIQFTCDLQILHHRIPTFWAAPLNQIRQASELSALLFSQFKVDSGTTRLGGCEIQLRPLTCLLKLNSEMKPSLLAAIDQDGIELSPQCLQVLSILQFATAVVQQLAAPQNPDLANLPDKNIHGTRTEDQKQIESAVRDFSAVHPKVNLAEVNLIVVGMFSYVNGKLTFTIESQSVSNQFSNWSGILQQNPSLCQPYHCPLTGDSGKHLAADDEGDIGLNKNIIPCSVTNRRLLQTKMDRCGNSQNWVCLSKLTKSATSDQWITTANLTTCPKCSMPTEKSGFSRGQCAACQALANAAVAATTDTANYLKSKWLVDQLCKTDEFYAQFKDATKSIFANSKFTWIYFQQQRCKHILVFDQADQFVVHRYKDFWQWRWKTRTHLSP